ncbi:ribonuclease J [Spiroplasma endosymbiont of 'Nebria riversi']|uniref:ribonuclease J n=1 Tax=Spiroplasma endosymbiont of 'Nebria riversi' TaxID=2792084 RepID=UPI001C05E606|nr:ribonuclease J [Spiroplasma endosymbiont of 'Nebria riversi']
MTTNQKNKTNTKIEIFNENQTSNKNNEIIIDDIRNTKVFALGGLEEVGKNTYCIEHDDEIIIIDAGVKFPEGILLGIDAIIPDYTYLKENAKKVKVIFITHGHEDHIGGIPYLLKEIDIPFIYAPRLAAALIRERLKEFNIGQKTKIIEIDGSNEDQNKMKGLLKNFQLKYFAVNHSIPDAFGIAINTPNGKVVTTGDYKFDWTPLGHKADLEEMTKMGQTGVTLFLSDSTNSEIEGYTMTETKIIKNISDYFLKAKGRILISTFASNVHRIQQIIEVAQKYNRKILIFGRSLERIIKIIREMGHLKISDKQFIKPHETDQYHKDEILIICTGSQGEPMAALSRISTGTHKAISIIPGDTVIFSSSPIPGNQANVEMVVNRLSRLGANVLENSSFNSLHTSGHASQEEQKLMLTLIKPTYFMPMHGDYRMLKAHGQTAESVGVAKENIFICANGDQINLYKGKAILGKRIEASAIYVDGKDTSGLTTRITRDRQILANDGLIAVVVSINSQTNELLCNPTIISRGSFYVKDSSGLIAESINIVTKAIKKVLASKHPTFGAIKKEIKETLSPYISKIKRRNPLIIPVILNKI